MSPECPGCVSRCSSDGSMHLVPAISPGGTDALRMSDDYNTRSDKLRRLNHEANGGVKQKMPPGSKPDGLLLGEQAGAGVG